MPASYVGVCMCAFQAIFMMTYIYKLAIHQSAILPICNGQSVFLFSDEDIQREMEDHHIRKLHDKIRVARCPVLDRTVRFWGKMSGYPVGQLNCPVFQLNAAYFVIKTEYQLKIAAQVVYYRSGTVVRRYTFLFA